jgi:hypothetical protein
MKRIRFTIASLLALILVLGVGFAALRESTDLWESGLLTLTLGVLLISILLAVHRTESRRAFWIGFALFGWIYLGLTLMPSIESRLLTSKALAYLDSKVLSRSVELYDRFVGPTVRQGIPRTTARSGQGARRWRIELLQRSSRLRMC